MLLLKKCKIYFMVLFLIPVSFALAKEKQSETKPQCGKQLKTCYHYCEHAKKPGKEQDNCYRHCETQFMECQPRPQKRLFDGRGSLDGKTISD